MKCSSLLSTFCCLVLLTVSLGQESCPAVDKCLEALDKGEPCPTLPVPEGSLAPPVAERGFNLDELRPGVYRYMDQVYSTFIIYRNKHLVVVDSPASAASFSSNGTYHFATAVLEVLNGETPKRLDMIYGHRHTDHIGAANIMKEFAEATFEEVEVRVWGTTETKSFIERASEPAIPVPDVIVRGRGRVIIVGGSIAIKLRVLGGHVTMDIATHILPSHEGPGVIHFADVVVPGQVPFLRIANTVDVARYVTVQEELLKLDFGFYSGAHGRLGSRKDVENNLAYTNSILEAAAEAVETADPDKVNEFFEKPMDPNAPEFGNRQWTLRNLYNLYSDICTRKLIEQWGCTLTGVDQYAPSHCVTAVIFSTIDNHKDLAFRPPSDRR